MKRNPKIKLKTIFIRRTILNINVRDERVGRKYDSQTVDTLYSQSTSNWRKQPHCVVVVVVTTAASALRRAVAELSLPDTTTAAPAVGPGFHQH